MVLLVSLSLIVILAGGIYYISSVQNSLWNKAVTDILEVTAQGRHALDTYIEKDMEMLHILTGELKEYHSYDTDELQNIMRLSGGNGASFVCVDLSSGVAYVDLVEEGYELEEEQLDVFRELQGNGIREPFLNNYTGVWTIGVYERFQFADGVEGYVQKTKPLTDISERFSLSFYDNKGFSYVVDREGNILIRSQHRNSNRTFQNLFDIIDLQGNPQKEVQSFRDALESGKKGVARFRYQDEDYVFCYVPMENAADWYAVSIVPNRVIMEQANSIVQHSQILFLLILASIIILVTFFLIYRDSTRRVLLAKEDARRAAESANVAKSRFLSNMSHDIRTPMNAIIGMTRLASDHVDEPEKVKEYLKNISLSGQLLVGLINDILDMSKIESGKMTLNPDNASLADLMTELVKIIQPTVWQKKQRFEVRLHDVEHETLSFDALRLKQIMLNLLSNAVKFTPEEGAISVDVMERPSTKEDCAHFTFRVSDTGIGMKPEFLEHLFDSFTREQDSRVSKIEGSGLGMAITKMIVDMMGGTISVKSEPGKGTVFTVELDLPLASDEPEKFRMLPSLRVLVADDDPATCSSVRAFLTELGVAADVMDSGKGAVEKVLELRRRGEEYQMIFLDWKMPDMNGTDAVRAIRAQMGKEVPIVIFSAYDWANIEKEAHEAGVTDFIQKPIFKSNLYRCIRQYVLQDTSGTEGAGEKVNLQGKRILLAEDNELNQEITRELLENIGVQVEIVDNGLACVDQFERSDIGYYDVILMDIQMPLMNGYEAAKRIRGLERGDAGTIPIFALTADAFAEDIEAAKEAGMNSHLAKPLDVPAMLREIQKYLGV